MTKIYHALTIVHVNVGTRTTGLSGTRMTTVLQGGFVRNPFGNETYALWLKVQIVPKQVFK